MNKDTLTRILERLEELKKGFSCDCQQPCTTHKDQTYRYKVGFNTCLSLAIQIIKEELSKEDI